jgi:hypothetical protein
MIDANTTKLLSLVVMLAGLASIALGVLVLTNSPVDNEALLGWSALAIGIGLFVAEARSHVH